MPSMLQPPEDDDVESSKLSLMHRRESLSSIDGAPSKPLRYHSSGSFDTSDDDDDSDLEEETLMWHEESDEMKARNSLDIQPTRPVRCDDSITLMTAADNDVDKVNIGNECKAQEVAGFGLPTDFRSITSL